MKWHFLLLITIHFSLFTLKVAGQNKPCNNFDCAYKKAENFLKQAAYQKALDNLDSAEDYLTDANTAQKEQIKQLRRRLFVAIDKEKEDAKKARDEAKRQTDIAKNALAQVEIEKQTAIEEKNKADSLFKIAEYQKSIAQKQTDSTKIALQRADSLFNVAETQRAKAQAILDKIYFYDDKFGLAYDKKIKEYGFIDKNLKTKINFRYKQATPFDYNGFAIVKSDHPNNHDPNDLNFRGDNYLIDTLGKPYFLSTAMSQLSFYTNALDFRNRQLKKIPILTSKQKQDIKILLLGYNSLTMRSDNMKGFSNLFFLDLNYNKIRDLPSSFGTLTNLTKLNLYGNQLENLPVEIGNLKNLKELDLRENPISEEEREKIKKILPNCKIFFDEEYPLPVKNKK